MWYITTWFRLIGIFSPIDYKTGKNFLMGVHLFDIYTGLGSLHIIMSWVQCTRNLNVRKLQSHVNTSFHERDMNLKSLDTSKQLAENGLWILRALDQDIWYVSDNVSN